LEQQDGFSSNSRSRGFRRRGPIAFANANSDDNDHSSSSSDRYFNFGRRTYSKNHDSKK
jgi:hypothetical protein